jgi:hypothetical protein
MLRKKDYKDLTKYHETKREQQARYRNKNGASTYKIRGWTIEEDKLVMQQSMPDSELSKLIKRSLGSIQTRRWNLRKRYE